MGLIKKVAKSLKQIDHRVIGQRQQLFFLDESSKGSCFFLPRGAHIYNKLVDYLRQQYKQRNYHEVITPNVYNCELFKTSGHWDHYEENMIKFHIGNTESSLKPMNCPAHCLMYKYLGTVHEDQLPIRWADFGVLHRNEASGALLGLSRVRRFQQDDAHIFCTTDQVESEVHNSLEFAKHVYDEFGFSFHVELSLRPEKYLGDIELWDKAESSLRQALSSSNLIYKEQSHEGAFYGPKIDLMVRDCQDKSQQCATIQLDFQLPQRFDLFYKDKLKDGCEAKNFRPVIIHRAILGSIERFIAMLAEHTGGRWPFWMSPLQACIIPLGESLNDYATNIRDRLIKEGFMVDCTQTEATLSKKISLAHQLKYNFILIVGEKEAEQGQVMVRMTVDEKVEQICVSVDRLVEVFKELNEKRARHSSEEVLLLFSK